MKTILGKSVLALALGLSLSALASEREGPVVSGGGTQTATEATGEALISVSRAGILVYIDSPRKAAVDAKDPAKLLYDSLDAKAYVPTGSTDEVKLTKQAQCTKRGERYSCMIGVE